MFWFYFICFFLYLFCIVFNLQIILDNVFFTHSYNVSFYIAVFVNTYAPFMAYSSYKRFELILKEERKREGIMLVNLKEQELKLIVDFLDVLGDKLGNAGCNDFELEDTPDNRALIAKAALYNDPKATEEDQEPMVYDGKLLTQDTLICGYLKSRITKVLEENDKL